MLKLEDIRYPITFHSYPTGFVTFQNDKDAQWHDGNKCTLGVDHFIRYHNVYNQADGDYSYEMAPVTVDGIDVTTMSDVPSKSLTADDLLSRSQAEEYEHSCLDNVIQSGVIIPDHRVSKAAHDVFEEMNSQDRKWGANRDHHPSLWQLILGEEVGEVCQAMLHDEFGGDHAGTVRAELVQVAAVAMQMIEFYDRQAK